MAGKIIIRDPVDQVAQAGSNRRAFDQFKHRAQFACINRLVAKNIIIPDHAGQFAGAKRHHYDAAGASVHIRRQPVIQRTNRLRQQDDTDAVGGRVHDGRIGNLLANVTHWMHITRRWQPRSNRHVISSHILPREAKTRIFNQEIIP